MIQMPRKFMFFRGTAAEVDGIYFITGASGTGMYYYDENLHLVKIFDFDQFTTNDVKHHKAKLAQAAQEYLENHVIPNADKVRQAYARYKNE